MCAWIMDSRRRPSVWPLSADRRSTPKMLNNSDAMATLEALSLSAMFGTGPLLLDRQPKRSPGNPWPGPSSPGKGPSDSSVPTVVGRQKLRVADAAW